jgi:glycosyltransferase involved in cell wall biosynthesis
MKLVYVAPLVQPMDESLRYGGVERLVWLLSEHFARELDEVIVIAAEGSKAPPGVKLRTVPPAGERDFEEKNILETALTLIDRKDVVFHDMSHSLRIAKVSVDMPAISTIWYDPHMMKPERPLRNIGAISQWQADRFKEVYNQEAKVIDPICEEAQSAFINGKMHDTRFISIGNWHPNKGQLEAIRLANRAKVPLDVIGGRGQGYPVYYENAMRQEAKRGRVRLHGEVSPKKKVALLQGASALIYPIHYPEGMSEAHSMKMCNAMLAGVPCVSYNVGAMPEVIDKGVTGLLAEDGNDFLAGMAEVVAFDREVVAERAKERWSVGAAAERLLPWYERVLGGERW